MKSLELRCSSPFHFVLIALLFASTTSSAQSSATLDLMPLPAHLVTGAGQLPVNGSFSVELKGYTEARLVAAKERFLAKLGRETGIPFGKDAQADGATLTIQTMGASEAVQRLGEDESYKLEVTADHARLTAPNPLGVLHGLQTFLQLVRITPDWVRVPSVTIDDQPRFPWRGLMIDAGRHFMPIDVIERNLDGMEAVKMNVFHWHLSEDQGFRVESKLFPLLQEKGSNGLYYTQAAGSRGCRSMHMTADPRGSGVRRAMPYDGLVCGVSGSGQRQGAIQGRNALGSHGPGDGPDAREHVPVSRSLLR